MVKSLRAMFRPNWKNLFKGNKREAVGKSRKCNWNCQKDKIAALQGLEKDVKSAIDAEGKKGVYALILTSNNALYGAEDISDSILKTLNSGK